MQQRELTPEAEKAIDRIQKLLALARNNDNEAEASLAMEAAQRMLEAHNLDMALVERKAGGASGQKREDQKTGGGLYKWQRTVWEHTAILNFCRYQSIRGLAKGSKYENRIIGSQVNVLATNVMGDYLQQTIALETRTKEPHLADLEGKDWLPRMLVFVNDGDHVAPFFDGQVRDWSRNTEAVIDEAWEVRKRGVPTRSKLPPVIYL